MANCSGSVSSPTFALEEEEDTGQAGEDILEDAAEVSLLLEDTRQEEEATLEVSGSPYRALEVAFKYLREPN